MQGAFAELDEDIGWNDFALRNYDPQIGRWVQQDPFQQFPSPYTGMGNDPTNSIDPSGGDVLPIGLVFKVGSSAAQAGGTAAQVLGTVSRGVNVFQAALSVTSIIFHAATILGNNVGTQGVGDRDRIYARGLNDAYWGAFTLGISELFGTNLSDYRDPYDQAAYLRGRLAGDALAVVQSATEIESGGGAALGGLASGPGAAVISTGGAVALSHGAAMGYRATSDAAWVTAKLIKLNLSLKTANENSLQDNAKSDNSNKNKSYPKDFSTKNTKNYSASYKSEGEARNLARGKLGKNPIEVEPFKWRSLDGKWQFRAKPGDINEKHIHLEELNPQTGEVLQNYHLRWQ